MLKLKLVNPPPVEPVTLSDIKNQLHFETSDDSPDEVIEPLISAAREWCESFQNRAYITQTLELALDNWPCGYAIEIPRPPLQSITSVIYTDNDGVATTWGTDNYIVDDYSFVAQLVKGRSIKWPSASLPSVNGIKIRYVAGYEDDILVPQRIKQAITLLVVHWYENGMCVPPQAVKSLLALDRVVPI